MCDYRMRLDVMDVTVLLISERLTDYSIAPKFSLRPPPFMVHRVSYMAGTQSRPRGPLVQRLTTTQLTCCRSSVRSGRRRDYTAGRSGRAQSAGSDDGAGELCTM